MSGVELVASRGAAPAPELGVCPSCGSGALTVFHEQESVPIHSCRLVATREEALAYPHGTLRLAFCSDCAFITNTAYDAALQDYGISYEETQGFSPRFRAFARELALRWIDRHDLRDKDVLEIGCGKGEFLALLCELGPNRGVGIDPAFVEERLDSPAAERMRFVTALYSERYAGIAADAVVCRHTLEHIAPVGEFMALVRRALGDRDAVVLFDVPDVVRVLREAAFWDVYYEHCSYFSPGSLARLFRRSGLDVVALERDYDDQYVVIDARPGAGRHAPLGLEEAPEELADHVETFRRGAAETTARWSRRLGAAAAAGRRIAVWGAGSKAVAFLNTVTAPEAVAYAVDVNPYKQGKYLAGTGHRVIGPDELVAEPPDEVVAMNAIYLDEIRSRLDGLGLARSALVAV